MFKYTMKNMLIMNAAGFIKTHKDADKMDSRGIFDIINLGTYTLKAKNGKRWMSIYKDPLGSESFILNKVGLHNLGVMSGIYWKSKRRTKTCISYHIQLLNEMDMLYERLPKDTYLELNWSCPNVDGEHLTPTFLKNVLYKARDLKFGKRIGVKLSVSHDSSKYFPIFQEYSDVIKFITLCNSIKTELGGLSGTYINRKLGVRKIKEYRELLYKNFLIGNILLVGCGGIILNNHIEEYRKAGADIVQIGSGLYLRDRISRL